MTIKIYRGRFAPTPSGDLHLGSLVCAIASFLESKTQNGKWLLRIDDVDSLRNKKNQAEKIIRTLEGFGFEWDEAIIWQSQNFVLYEDFLKKLSPFLYACRCSRKDLQDAPKTRDGSLFYEGLCRNKNFPFDFAHALRFTVPDEDLVLNDLFLGEQTENLFKECGDFVLKRKDNVFAYHLASVVDDYLHHITHIVRGEDLLESSFRQMALQKALNFPIPFYGHIPLVKNEKGEKLSKQTHAPAITLHNASALLWEALDFLKQGPPLEIKKASTVEIWDWAKKNWKRERLIAQMPAFLD